MQQIRNKRNVTTKYFVCPGELEQELKKASMTFRSRDKDMLFIGRFRQKLSSATKKNQK